MYYRKYIFNENYFSLIDTPDKAYWLGFIATDGNVFAQSKIGYSMKIELAARDIDHLKLFAKNIEHNKLPTHRKRNNNVVFNVCSKIMVNDLIKHGVGPNKTFTIKPWCGPSELLPHYWRGAFDGDGGIWTGFDKRNNTTVRWDTSFIGNKYMVNGFAEYVRSFNDLYSLGTIRSVENVFRISWGGIRPCQTVIKHLNYTTGSISLHRKMILVEKLLNTKIR